jgi:hypothetical protein
MQSLSAKQEDTLMKELRAEALKSCDPIVKGEQDAILACGGSQLAARIRCLLSRSNHLGRLDLSNGMEGHAKVYGRIASFHPGKLRQRLTG